MNYLIIVISISLALNIFLVFTYYRVKKAVRTRQNSLELNEFLMDLLAGEALIKVSRVSPTDVFLRSPRNGRN